MATCLPSYPVKHGKFGAVQCDMCDIETHTESPVTAANGPLKGVKGVRTLRYSHCPPREFLS